MNIIEARAILELAIGDYVPIRQAYRTRIFTAILDFLGNNANILKSRNSCKIAIQEAFYPAAEMGITDGGGEAPLQGDDLAWLNGRADMERANIDNLFAQLSLMRKDPEYKKSEATETANLRADGYTLTLDAIYNEAKLRGAKNKMLTFGGEDGHSAGFPCPTCRKLKYPHPARHRASWWVSHGLLPYPGNSAYACGAWQCKHFLFDDGGNVWTI